jgi:hypothetical protein
MVRGQRGLLVQVEAPSWNHRRDPATKGTDGAWPACFEIDTAGTSAVLLIIAPGAELRSSHRGRRVSLAPSPRQPWWWWMRLGARLP